MRAWQGVGGSEVGSMRTQSGNLSSMQLSGAASLTRPAICLIPDPCLYLNPNAGSHVLMQGALSSRFAIQARVLLWLWLHCMHTWAAERAPLRVAVSAALQHASH